MEAVAAPCSSTMSGETAPSCVAGVTPCGTTIAGVDTDGCATGDCTAPCGRATVGVAGALSTDVVSTCRSTIKAAFKSGVDPDDGSDPDASEASRKRPELWNA